MKFKPLENHLICEKIDSVKQDLENILIPTKPECLDIYQVKEMNVNNKDSFVKVGDSIICNSTGISLEDNLYLFKMENVASVILEV